MSILLMSQAWKLELPPLEKLVLLDLCDRANDEGEGVWPRVKTMAKRAGIAHRTVRKVLRSLREQGLIILVEERPGRSNVYAVSPGAMMLLKSEQSKGMHDMHTFAQEGMHEDHTPPVQDDTPGMHEDHTPLNHEENRPYESLPVKGREGDLDGAKAEVVEAEIVDEIDVEPLAVSIGAKYAREVATREDNLNRGDLWGVLMSLPQEIEIPVELQDIVLAYDELRKHKKWGLWNRRTCENWRKLMIEAGPNMVYLGVRDCVENGWRGVGQQIRRRMNRGEGQSMEERAERTAAKLREELNIG